MAMNALTSLAPHGKGSFKASAERARMAGNASNSAQFRKDDGDGQQQTPRPRPRLRAELLSQVETKRHDPFWDGPRLTPAFVTQLLGQVMQQEQNRLVRTAYGNAEEKSARLFDKRL